MSDFEMDPAPRIVERHHPMQALFEAFPEAASMERDLFQRVLGVPIRREQRQAGGSYEYRVFVDWRDSLTSFLRLADAD